MTDPPYGVNYDKGVDTIENDDLKEEELKTFLTAAFTNASQYMRTGAAFYIWHASKTVNCFIAACQRADLDVKQTLIWVKNTFVLGRQDYQWRHEPCLYGWKEGGAHYFIDVRSFTTVFDRLDEMTREELIAAYKDLASITTAIYEDKPSVSGLHPTMKPLNLFKKLIRNSSKKGDLVLDLFCGSGTTLLAAEEMGRRCYAMEYDPHYCDVIISRWEEQTGKTASKIE